MLHTARGLTRAGSVTVTATSALWRSPSNPATAVFSSRCSSTLASSRLTCPRGQGSRCMIIRAPPLPPPQQRPGLHAHLPGGGWALEDQAFQGLQGRLPALPVLRCGQSCREAPTARIRRGGWAGWAGGGGPGTQRTHLPGSPARTQVSCCSSAPHPPTCHRGPARHH